jgi:hypothetical protein
VAGKVREIAIAREVGDSVLYRSLLRLASCRRFKVTCPKCRLFGNLLKTHGSMSALACCQHLRFHPKLRNGTDKHSSHFSLLRSGHVLTQLVR